MPASIRVAGQYPERVAGVAARRPVIDRGMAWSHGRWLRCATLPTWVIHPESESASREAAFPQGSSADDHPFTPPICVNQLFDGRVSIPWPATASAKACWSGGNSETMDPSDPMRCLGTDGVQLIQRSPRKLSACGRRALPHAEERIGVARAPGIDGDCRRDARSADTMFRRVQHRPGPGRHGGRCSRAYRRRVRSSWRRPCGPDSCPGLASSRSF